MSLSCCSGAKAEENGSLGVWRDGLPEDTVETRRIDACRKGVFAITMTRVVLDF